jgi:outer membrane receptor protein involved in Fe transport
MTPVRNLLVICAFAGNLVFSRAEALDELSHDIAAQPLAQALGEFANQTGLQLIYVSEIAATQSSRGAPRGLAVPDALRQLLAGTGLGFEFLNNRTVRIIAGSSCALRSGCSARSPGAAERTRGRPLTQASPPDSLEEVIVSSLRWRLGSTQALASAIVLDRRDLERGGKDSLGKVLQSLPMSIGSPLNANVNAGGAEPLGRGAAGDGSFRVFLHDLPTVVLLNGRRMPNSGIGADASVDFNTLPVTFIDRVEVLANGAPASFGSDSVGGVVNIVTRPNFAGLELNGSRTIAERGDGELVTGQAAIGFGLLGGTWGLGLDYVEQTGVTMDRRRHSAYPLTIVDGDGTVAPAGRDWATPDGRFVVPADNALGLEPGVYTRVAGATGQTAADYRPFVRSTDGFNPAPFHYLQTPSERASLWLLGSRPLSESVELFVEALVHQRKSAQQASPRYIFEESAGDNYYNPFGVDLPSGGIARRFLESGNRRTEQDVDLWRALVALEGTVGRWQWELAIGNARSESTTVEKGLFSYSRLAEAVGPSGPDDSGRIVCGLPDPATGRVPAARIIAGCVPLNLFGGAGSISQAQLDYVSPRPLINTGSNEQRTAQLVASGPGGRGLGGDLRWVLGADYRREAGGLALDPLNAAGDFLGFDNTVSSMGRVASGAYEARELFADLQAPILHDRPLARDLTLTVGARWSDYSSFDQNTAWQTGLLWRPTAEMMVRANYAEVFRAPNIVDLYDPLTRYEGWFEHDPCGNGPTPTEQANCAANGVPGGAYVQGEELFTVFAGGNPRLEPETGDSFGVGLVYTPAWAEGLSASVDYFQVAIRDYIYQSYPNHVLLECARRGVARACSNIRRHPDGSLVEVATYTENFGGLDVRGFDLAIDWSIASRLGDLQASLLATYLDRWNEQQFPGGETYSYAGKFDTLVGARPRWRASGHVDWHSGPWMASYAAEYIGSYSELVEPFPELGIEFEPFTRRVDPVLYHDIEAGFTFDSDVKVRAAITNVTDEDPPYVNISPGNTDAATYRLLGRSYFLEFRYQVP